MRRSSYDELTIQNQFDYLCKRALKGEAVVGVVHLFHRTKKALELCDRYAMTICVCNFATSCRKVAGIVNDEIFL